MPSCWNELQALYGEEERGGSVLCGRRSRGHGAIYPELRDAVWSPEWGRCPVFMKELKQLVQPVVQPRS